MTKTHDTCTVEVTLSKEAFEHLQERAKRAGVSVEEFLAEVAEGQARTRGQKSRLEQEIEWLTNRTPEEIEQARRDLRAASRPTRPLPEGKTLSDMVEGKWPGDETDKEVNEALKRLS